MSHSFTKNIGLIFVSVALSLAAAKFWLIRDEDAAEIKTSSAGSSPAIAIPSGKDIEAAHALSKAMIQVAAQVKPAVVTVFTERIFKVRRVDPFFGGFFRDFFEGPSPRSQFEERKSQGLGSGVIVSADGVIVTNNHVIDEADTIQVRTLNGETFKAKLLGKDPQTDLAVIKIDATNLHYLNLGDSEKLQVGEIVLAVGSPMSEKLAHTVTQGIVSATGRADVGIVALEDFIQTDAAINPGNSGGALVNLAGELVGINSAIVTQSGGSQGIGFAIPVNLVRAVKSSIEESGEVVRAWLGVETQDVSKDLADALGVSERKGVLIANVDPKGPAAKAGLRSGDMIVEMDASPIDSAVQLRNRIATSRPGSKIHFKVLRDGKDLSIEATLEKVAGSAKEASSQQSLLGISATNLTPELLQKYRISKNARGVCVVSVSEDGIAAQVGIQPGDVIASINQKPTPTMKEFSQQTKNLNAGDRLLLQVQRGPGNYFVVVTIGG